MLANMLISLILTVIIETICARILGVKGKHDICTVILANVFTNPIVTFSVYTVQARGSYTAYVITYVLAEAFAFISEWLIYSKKLEYKKLHPFLLSFILNGITLSIGILMAIL